MMCSFCNVDYDVVPIWCLWMCDKCGVGYREGALCAVWSKEREKWECVREGLLVVVVEEVM